MTEFGDPSEPRVIIPQVEGVSSMLFTGSLDAWARDQLADQLTPGSFVSFLTATRADIDTERVRTAVHRFASFATVEFIEADVDEESIPRIVDMAERGIADFIENGTIVELGKVGLLDFAGIQTIGQFYNDNNLLWFAQHRALQMPEGYDDAAIDTIYRYRAALQRMSEHSEGLWQGTLAAKGKKAGKGELDLERFERTGEVDARSPGGLHPDESEPQLHLQHAERGRVEIDAADGRVTKIRSGMLDL